ncbi:MAG: cbb3-type cytochrome oxidase assembly protein CcoS [Verrucomicrobiota bacterium]
MSVIGILLLGSVLVVPAAGLWALHWAGRSGQFRHPERDALLPFSEEEPVGRATDLILRRREVRP